MLLLLSSLKEIRTTTEEAVLLSSAASRKPSVKLQASLTTRKVFAFQKDSSVSNRVPSNGRFLRTFQDLFTEP